MHSKTLIVDDDPNIREVLSVLLSSEGYDVTEAENGTMALEKVNSMAFDIVILDIMMPDMDGIPRTETRWRLIPPAATIFWRNRSPRLSC